MIINKVILLLQNGYYFWWQYWIHPLIEGFKGIKNIFNIFRDIESIFFATKKKFLAWLVRKLYNLKVAIIILVAILDFSSKTNFQQKSLLELFRMISKTLKSNYQKNMLLQNCSRLTIFRSFQTDYCANCQGIKTYPPP